jgi:hypothetical protein
VQAGEGIICPQFDSIPRQGVVPLRILPRWLSVGYLRRCRLKRQFCDALHFALPAPCALDRLGDVPLPPAEPQGTVSAPTLLSWYLGSFRSFSQALSYRWTRVLPSAEKRYISLLLPDGEERRRDRDPGLWELTVSAAPNHDAQWVPPISTAMPRFEPDD